MQQLSPIYPQLSLVIRFGSLSLQWRHNERDDVSNHRRLDGCSTVCSDAGKKIQQSSASLAFCRGNERWPVDFPHKGPVTRKMFPLDKVIMYFVVPLATPPPPHRIIWLFVCTLRTLSSLCITRGDDITWNIFCIIALLCGGSPGFPVQRASNAEVCLPD